MIGKLLGRTVPVSGYDFPLGESAQIGAEPGNDVCILAPGVSGVHATIRREGNMVWLEDAGTINGTFLNGSRIEREVIRHLDVISLGNLVDLIFVSGGAAPVDLDASSAPAMVPAAGGEAGAPVAATLPRRQVRVTLAGRSGRFTLEAGTYTIGRSRAAQIRVS